MPNTFSEFHDVICQSSQLIYTDHFEDSIQFYENIGFTQRHKENQSLCILRIKHTYIELWNQKYCHVNTSSAETLRDQHHRSIVIYVNSKKSLMKIHEHINQKNINTHDHALHADSAPLGYCFSINDPDNNLITFATGPVWSYPYEYEHNCYMRRYGKHKETENDNEITEPSNVLYPDFSQDDKLDDNVSDDLDIDLLDDEPE